MFVRWFHSAHACLVTALLGTAASTALLVCAVCSDHWEHIVWDRAALHSVSAARNTTKWTLDWLLDGQVARLMLPQSETPSSSSGHTGPAYFLIPMNGGIWTLCASLDEQEHSLLQQLGFPRRRCANFLSEPPGTAPAQPRPGWQHRMQNLSISCALVCLILLGSSAVVGAFGIIAHQISAVLVTGVLYLLAASFATFTLTINHLKRTHSTGLRAASGGGPGATGGDGMLPSVPGSGPPGPLPPAALWSQLISARRVNVAWSLQLGWAGVAASLLTAALWIGLSKAMRHSPLST